VVCFFFQAEDGIRDFHVTGVQTCALPIYMRNPVNFVKFIVKGSLFLQNINSHFRMIYFGIFNLVKIIVEDNLLFSDISIAFKLRSEERRVGKECRSGGSWYTLKANGRTMR